MPRAFLLSLPAAQGAQRSPLLTHLCNLRLTFEQEGMFFKSKSTQHSVGTRHCVSHGATALPSSRREERMRGNGEEEDRGEREAGPRHALTEKAVHTLRVMSAQLCPDYRNRREQVPKSQYLPATELP